MSQINQEWAITLVDAVENLWAIGRKNKNFIPTNPEYYKAQLIKILDSDVFDADEALFVRACNLNGWLSNFTRPEPKRI